MKVNILVWGVNVRGMFIMEMLFCPCSLCIGGILILKEGDKVRVSVKKSLFLKESWLNWSRSIYVVNSVRLTDHVTYRLVDDNGEIVSGSFYRQELQKVG